MERKLYQLNPWQGHFVWTGWVDFYNANPLKLLCRGHSLFLYSIRWAWNQENHLVDRVESLQLVQVEVDPILNEKSLVIPWRLWLIDLYLRLSLKDYQKLANAIERHERLREVPLGDRFEPGDVVIGIQGYIKLKPLQQNPPSVRSVFTWKGKRQVCQRWAQICIDQILETQHALKLHK